MMLRPRRSCAIAAICILTIYFCVSVLLVDTNLETVLYRIWYINGFPNSSEAVEIACYHDYSYNTLPEMEASVPPDKSIFFVETSCHTAPRIHLTPRQACAVESAAKVNPESKVYLLFPSPVVHNVSDVSASVEQLLTYPNIRLRHVPMHQFFEDTPMDSWYRLGYLQTSHWPRSHASDILRYLTLWKFGGIYLDLDVVVTKSLTDLVNYAGAESNEDVAAGVLSFATGGYGHQMAEACVRDLLNNFRGYDWGNNGPGVITRVLQRWCGTDKVDEMTPEKCNGFTVFPPRTFYPIPWRKWHLYFDSNHSEYTLKMVASSRAIHVWNRFSTQANVTVGSTQPYGLIASKYCPKVYSNVGPIF